MTHAASRFFLWSVLAYTRFSFSPIGSFKMVSGRLLMPSRLTRMVPAVPSNTQSARTSLPSVPFSNSLWITVTPLA